MLKELLALREEAPTLSKKMYENVMKTKRALVKQLAPWFEQGEQVKLDE